jgi:hypothetical protein
MNPTHSPDQPHASRRKILTALLAGGTVAGIAPLALEAIDACRHDFATLVDDQPGYQALVDNLSAREYAARHNYYTRPNLPTLVSLLTDLEAIEQAIRAPVPVRYQQELIAIGGRMSVIVAELLLNLGQPRMADHWLGNANHAAVQIGDLSLRAWVHQSAGMLAFYTDRPDLATTHGNRVEALLSREHYTHPALTVTTAMHARIVALHGDEPAVSRYASDAEDMFAALPDRDCHHAIFGYARHRLHFHLGSALAQVGSIGRALDHLDQAVHYAPETDTMERTLAELDKAGCLMRYSDPDAGLSRLTATWDGLPPDRRVPLLRDYANRTIRVLPDQHRTSPRYQEALEVLAA